MRSRFQVLEDEATDLAPTPAPAAPPKRTAGAHERADEAESTARSALAFCVLALRVLSLRSVQLAGHLLPLFALATGFALWWRVLPEPSPQQLGGLGLYGAFMLLLIVVRKE